MRSSGNRGFVRAHPDLLLTDRGRCVSRRGGTQGAWRAASTGEPMVSGAHYAEFTIERKIYGHFFGVIRPGWNVERVDVTGAHSEALAAAHGHCMYFSLSGKRWPDNSVWEGMATSREGDRIGATRARATVTRAPPTAAAAAAPHPARFS